MIRKNNCTTQNESIVRNIIKNYYTTDTDKIIQSKVDKHNLFNSSLIKKNNNVRKSLNNIAIEYYPNEAIIRAQFIREILSKTKNQTTIIELPILSSRCDIAKFNHISIGYEIKTKFDTPFRLDSQIKNYSEIFEKVYIIIPENYFDKYYKLLNKSIGIYTYRLNEDKYTFKCTRRAEKNTVSPEKQLSQITVKYLRKHFKRDDKNRDELTNYIMSNYTDTYINSTFKKYYKSKYQDKWHFIEKNIHKIYELDLGWFFKTNIQPELFYKSRESLM